MALIWTRLPFLRPDNDIAASHRIRINYATDRGSAVGRMTPRLGDAGQRLFF
jgi:hypothetical protein